MQPGIVLTGKVLDAETGKPIADAEVAPLKWGHHSSWADWDESVKTDREGSYRMTTSSAEGIATKHPDYREDELGDSRWAFEPGHNVRKKTVWSQGEQRPEQKVGPDGFVFRLHPLMTLRGRVLDVDGKPIAGVSVGGSDSDAQGRFCVKVTREEWDQPEKLEISFFALNYRWLNVPLKDFSFDKETVITLEREPSIRGQVLDENGKPLEDCTIELKGESEHVLSRFETVPGPHKQGKWKTHISEHDRVFTLRVSVAGSIRSLKQYTLEEVTGGPIITKLAEGHRLTARLVARVPLDEKSTPVVLLSSTANEELRQQAQVHPDGSFTFSGLADAKHTLRLYPAICSVHRGGSMKGVAAYSTFGFASPNKPWEKSITIRGSDVELDPINLHDAGLLPGWPSPGIVGARKGVYDTTIS